MSEMNDQEKQMLHEVHGALIGNENLGHEGLVKKVARHDHWIQQADVKLGMVVGGCAVIVFLIELLFKK